MWSFLYKLSSPKAFYRLSRRLIPWFAVISALAFAYGLIGGVVLAPADYQQGDVFRIIYIHVPSAFLSLFIFSYMAFLGLLSLVWRIKMADVVLKVSAPLGAWFTFLALVTGAIWGEPTWGTWWVWDARLTSELILLFLYFGVIALSRAIPDRQAAGRAAAIMSLVGFVDIPIIHYSVFWWNTLHQGATISKFAKPSIAPLMLYPLLSMIIAFFCYFSCVMLIKARAELLERERKSRWVTELLEQRA